MQTGTTGGWEQATRTLLDEYLREFGLDSADSRACWADRVIADMQARTDVIVEEDIPEEAIEHLLELIGSRLALVARPEASSAHRELARVQFLLMNRNNAAALNALFEHAQEKPDPATLEHVRNQLTGSIPVPVPEEAPLTMPEQAIDLRSLNPLHRLFGHQP
jgi:hypothetical protein